MNPTDHIKPDGREFHLTFWGGIQNDGLAAKLLGTDKTDFWFQTREEREQFRQMLEGLGDEHGQIVAIDENEGPLCSKRTVAVMVMLYQGKEYPYEYDFGYGYDEGSAHYMWFEGNYACDCNKTIMLSQKYDDVKEGECGDEIKLKDFRVEYRD